MRTVEIEERKEKFGYKPWTYTPPIRIPVNTPSTVSAQQLPLALPPSKDLTEDEKKDEEYKKQVNLIYRTWFAEMITYTQFREQLDRAYNLIYKPVSL